MPERRLIPSWLAIDWWVLLIISFVESGFYDFFQSIYPHLPKDDPFSAWLVTVWGILQAHWLWRADGRCKVLWWYLTLAGVELMAIPINYFVRPSMPEWLVVLLGFTIIAFTIASIFQFRKDMVWYFGETEDPYFTLSGVMTLFFSDFYFQYHFHRLAQLQKFNDELRRAPA